MSSKGPFQAEPLCDSTIPEKKKLMSVKGFLAYLPDFLTDHFEFGQVIPSFNAFLPSSTSEVLLHLLLMEHTSLGIHSPAENLCTVYTLKWNISDAQILWLVQEAVVNVTLPVQSLWDTWKL